MATLQQTWKTTKTEWSKKGSGKVPLSVKLTMKRGGWDRGSFGKALAKVDAASDVDDRIAAWQKALPTLAKYQTVVKKAAGDRAVGPDGKKALQALLAGLEDVRKEGEKRCQPPSPGSRSTKLELVLARNAAGGLKSRYLEVGKLDIRAWIVLDVELEKLMKSGELGFHWIEVQRACNKVVQESVDAFAKTIEDLDAKIDLMDARGREAKVKEANEVLQHYARIVERRVNEVVDGYWKRALQRRAWLKEFKKEVQVDIAISTVTIAVSTVNLAMSFGTAAISVLAMAKAAWDIAVSIEKLARSAAVVRRRLEPKMDKIERLWEQREKAKKAGKGQKASKAGEVGKEAVASALGSGATFLMTTTSRTLKEAKEYAGKLTEAEQQAGVLYKQIQEFTRAMPSAPRGPDAHRNRAMNQAHNQFKVFNQQYQDFARELAADIAWAENAVEICSKLSDEDYVPRWTKTAGTCTKTAIGLGAVGKLTYQLATAVV
jgi:hypothetical protein